jgi:hypothetical protein
VTLKAVGAIPTIYLTLAIDLRKPMYPATSKQALINRNPDFASAWAYGFLTNTPQYLSVQTARSNFVKFFTKARNPNKLYLTADRSFFLSPGIVLRHYSDPEARHLKKRPKTWVYTVTALSKATTRPWVVEFSDLFGKKEFLLKRLFVQKIPTSWFLFRAFFLSRGFGNKPRRRIKKWVKKKYFRLTSSTL